MPFEPGVSGNPGGRRKEKPWAEALRKAAYAIPDDDPLKRQRLALMAEALVLKAQSGDVSALTEVGNRLDGKVPQALIGSDDPDDPPLALQLVELRPVKPEGEQ